MSSSFIIGCDEMREQGIDTNNYGYNRDPGIHRAVIDFMAESRKKGTLRIFLTFSDGRKIIAPVYWWQQYLGFPERKPGDLVRLTFEKIEDGRVFLTAAESVEVEDGPYEVI